MSYPESEFVASATVGNLDHWRPHLDWAERRSLWLFPVYAHSKQPANKWKTESSSLRADWERWIDEGFMLGINAAKSGKILLDLDVGKVDVDLALEVFRKFLAEFGSEWIAPYCRSPSGGYHFMVDRPAGYDPEQMQGIWKPRMTSDARPLAEDEKDAELISVRNRGYCVGPGSHFGKNPYLLIASADERHACPPALLEKLRLPEVVYNKAGISCPTDLAAVIAFLDSHGEFDDEESWKFTGLGAVKLALGDTEEGCNVARQITWADVSEAEFLYHWNRMDAVEKPGKNYRRVGTLIYRAEQLGRKFHVRKAIDWSPMLASLPGLASPSIAPGLPTVAPLAPMVGQTAAIIADLAGPTVDEFLSCTTDVPAPSPPYPLIPETVARHYPDTFAESLNQAVGVVGAMTEPMNRKAWKSGRVLKLLAVVKEVDQPTFTALTDRIKMAGLSLPAAQLAQACHQLGTKLAAAVFGATRTDFIRGSNGRPDSGNSDNVAIFLNLSARKARFDSFTRTVEIAKGEQPFKRMDQDRLDDTFVEARSSVFDFQAKSDFFRTSVKSIARRDTYDSLQAHIAALPVWDGIKRLDTWLAKVCGVEPDQYHAIAGRTIIGGMIARARRPGCYFRHVLLLIATGQNEGKTYLCRVLAGNEWVSIGFKLGGSEQNMRPKLAGKWVVELGELAGLTRDNVEDVKTFLSESDDEFVAKYESETARHPRRCVFIATSNNESHCLTTITTGFCRFTSEARWIFNGSGTTASSCLPKPRTSTTSPDIPGKLPRVTIS